MHTPTLIRHTRCPERSVETLSPIDEVMHAFLSIGRRMRHPAAGDVVEPGNFWLLKILHGEGSLRVTELASLAGLDTSTVSRHVAQLQKTGLIERTPDPDDGRAQRVGLTGAGETQLVEAFECRRALLSSGITDWTEADVGLLGQLLTRFVETIETAEARAAELDSGTP